MSAPYTPEQFAFNPSFPRIQLCDQVMTVTPTNGDPEVHYVRQRDESREAFVFRMLSLIMERIVDPAAAPLLHAMSSTVVATLSMEHITIPSGVSMMQESAAIGESDPEDAKLLEEFNAPLGDYIDNLMEETGFDS